MRTPVRCANLVVGRAIEHANRQAKKPRNCKPTLRDTTERGVTPSAGRLFTCPNCGETLTSPARKYTCPKGRPGWIA